VQTRSPGLRELLVAAGEAVWAGGPLAKPPGLCHGTDGDGHAFLKLHAMTGEARWLERARAFAMHALQQSGAETRKQGSLRFTVWSGDLGLALYLSSCLRADPAFPTLDVFWSEPQPTVSVSVPVHGRRLLHSGLPAFAPDCWRCTSRRFMSRYSPRSISCNCNAWRSVASNQSRRRFSCCSGAGKP
jgi:hypothetical protein